MPFVPRYISSPASLATAPTVLIFVLHLTPAQMYSLWPFGRRLLLSYMRSSAYRTGGGVIAQIGCRLLPWMHRATGRRRLITGKQNTKQRLMSNSSHQGYSSWLAIKVCQAMRCL